MPDKLGLTEPDFPTTNRSSAVKTTNCYRELARADWNSYNIPYLVSNTCIVLRKYTLTDGRHQGRNPLFKKTTSKGRGLRV